MGNLDDGPQQKPLNEFEVENAILNLLPQTHFDLIITHNPNGEYTRHIRHDEVGKAVIRLWNVGKIAASELWTFAYEDGNKDYYPRPVESASVFQILTNWKYVCNVLPQLRTKHQNVADLDLAEQLGIEKKITYATNTISRNFMPYFIGACDIYAAPSRLEGFGMPQVEAGACAKPVLGINAMGMLDTLVHKETAFLANVAKKIVVNQVILGGVSGFEDKHTPFFDETRDSKIL